MLTNALMLIGTIGGGLLGNINLAFPYVGRALLLALVGGWAFLHMHDLGFTPRAMTVAAIPAEMRKVARESITYGWRKQPVRLFMLVTFIQGLYFIWGFYATQPYFLDLLGKPDAIWVAGVIAALGSLVGIVGNWLVARFMSRFRLRTTILIAS